MKLRFTGDPQDVRRIGLDIEALPWVNWYDKPYGRHVLCIGWGTESDVQYTEGPGRRAGRLKLRDLKRLRAELSAPDVVVVGHNAFRYDLPVVSGVLIAHGLEPLPPIRCQDTLGDLKTGFAFRNSLKAKCKRYGVQLKGGGPDWDLVLMGDREEWDRMQTYNVNDVVCTLQLERALAKAGLPCPIRTWYPRKATTR